MSRRKCITLPLDTHDEVKVQAHPDDGDVKICLPKGGFIRAGLFRFALDKGRPGEAITRGPVTVRVLPDTRGLDVEVRMSDELASSCRFEGDVLDEIFERIDWINAMLHSYKSDPAAMEKAEKKRRESRNQAAAA